MEANAYWEQKRKFYEVQEEEVLLKRISECQMVVDKLEKDELWAIIQADVDAWINQVDSVWQDVYDVDQLNKMRTVKVAASHIKRLKESYISDWKIAKEELESRKNKDIKKDYED